ncbi:PDZ and LIM domain protein 7 isoform X1 [Manacus vitellinus]|uniref:PDZ and LIM domain protein 7 isoform X1 n=2 Tax=Manacus TaxID=196036 RepID=UPI00115E87A6|nr:PDZ and LIM domain protein 7 isoform X1 [Manacus vitellinus]
MYPNARITPSSLAEMGDMESYKVMLNGPAPWGFRLQGGKDFSMPLSISRLTPGGKAAQAGVGVGDWVLYIDGESTSAMTHIEAQNRIRACGDRLCLTLSRAQNQLGKPQKVLSLDKQPPQLLEPPSSPVCDPVKLRMLEDIDDSQPHSWTSQSRSFRKLARLVGADSMEDGEDELVKKPRDAHGSGWGTVEQWQPPQPLEPPRSPGCDPGKLRMLEDAEDWQPRTGTSQSRSFRKLAQLTGTDGMEDHDEMFVRKPSQVSVSDPSPGAAMKTEPGLAPRTPTATPGPTSRPPWAVDPSFAERYAPDKTSTVVSKHSQPATPTPMQNRSSIVQAAQQAPEGPGCTPLCYKCNKVIRGRYLVALGHYYHPEEFTCCQCRKVLDEGGFFEEKGSIFCPKCYDSRYAPSCAKCKKKITGEVMHALKMTWHVQCFTCNACKTPIRNRAFYMEEGQPYCERDYEKMFGTKCRGCDFKIDAGDRFLEALGFSWHDTCFVCAICQTNLEGKTFYSKKDKPLCKSHAFSHV